MVEQRHSRSPRERNRLAQHIDTKPRRELRGQHGKEKSIWFGLGFLGLIGWSVSVPLLLGVAVGLWIDQHYPSRASWTLGLVIVGLLIGCLNAWRWVEKEHRAIRREQENEDKPKDKH
jgi:ATP synthase protein I